MAGNDTPRAGGWIPTRDAAEELGVTQRHIRRLIRDGKLRSTIAGDIYLVDRRSLERYDIERKEWPQSGLKGGAAAARKAGVL